MKLIDFFAGCIHNRGKTTTSKKIDKLSLLDKTSNLEQANEESRQQLREYEETKKQIEEDADREILDIKNKTHHHLLILEYNFPF